MSLFIIFSLSLSPASGFGFYFLSIMSSHSSSVSILHTITVPLCRFPGFTSPPLLLPLSFPVLVFYPAFFWSCFSSTLYLSLPACFLSAWQGVLSFPAVCVCERVRVYSLCVFTHLCAYFIYFFVHSCIYECVMAVVKQAATPPILRLADQSWKGEYLMIIEKWFFYIHHSLKSTVFELNKVCGT